MGRNIFGRRLTFRSKEVHKMKFGIEKVSKSSGRIGLLTNSVKQTSLKTPLLIQCTKGGSIPHLSHEAFNYITCEAPILLISLSTITHMTESLKVFKHGVSEFVGHTNSLNILSVRDVCETSPSGFNSKDVIPLFTRKGKESLSAEQYMKMVELISPDIYMGLSDADTNELSSKKRVQKSVDRTDEFFSYCYERHKKSDTLSKKSILAPIVGGYNKFARSLSIQRTNCKPDVFGYVLDGFHNNGHSAMKVNQELLVDVVSHCVSELDPNKPRMMVGAYSPLAVLELIALGVDIFDTSYAFIAAINFKALTFKFEFSNKPSTKTFVDITDESLKENFAPFLEGCECIVCKQHTMAYIHHLYNTKEMLGPILLMIHNIHHYINFFGAIRSSIAGNTLQKMIELIKFQETKQPVDYMIPLITSKHDGKKNNFKQM